MQKVFLSLFSPHTLLIIINIHTWTQGGERVRVKEKGKKKIYFQHFQHNKINDLLLYHHNVLRNCAQQVGAALRLSHYVCTYIYMALVGGHVRCWRCFPIRVTKIVQHRSSAIHAARWVTKKYVFGIAN